MATLESYKTLAEKVAANAAASETNAEPIGIRRSSPHHQQPQVQAGWGECDAFRKLGGRRDRDARGRGREQREANYAQQSAASATTAGQKADAAMEHADSAENKPESGGEQRRARNRLRRMRRRL